MGGKMEKWLDQNLLAIYGAVVGTIALLLNFKKYRHEVSTTKVGLKVGYVRHSNYDENVAALKTPGDPWNSPSVAPVYEIEIINSGSIGAFIKSAGVVTSSGERKEALVSQNHGSLVLVPISCKSDLVIPPKSSEKYCVYLHRGEEPFEAAYAFAFDKVGGGWKSKGAWGGLLNRQVARTLLRSKF